jgi:hypothetical protein
MAAKRSWPRLRSMMRVRDGSPKGGDAFSRLRALHDSPPAPLRAGTPVPIYPCVTPTLSLAGIRKLGAQFLWHGCMPARPEPLSGAEPSAAPRPCAAIAVEPYPCTGNDLLFRCSTEVSFRCAPDLLAPQKKLNFGTLGFSHFTRRIVLGIYEKRAPLSRKRGEPTALLAESPLCNF